MKFPKYERQAGLQGGTTASYAGSAAMAAPARALQGLGGEMVDAGQRLQAAQDRISDTQDDVWLSKARAETAMQMGKYDNQARLAATGDASGYQDDVLGQFEQVRQGWMEQAPSENARLMYEQWSNGYHANVWGETAKFRAASELNQRNDDFASAMLAHSQTVFDNPEQYDSVRQRAIDDLEGAKQWMTPEQETAARNKVEQELQLARAKSTIMRDPAGFLNSIGVEQARVENAPSKVKDLSFRADVNKAINQAASRYGVSPDAMRVIAQIESSGNPNAKNPSSSAGGLFQFIDSTARQFGLRDKYDPYQASDAAARLMRANASALRATLGRDPNVGELYLAHQQGAGGATRLLGNPDARAVDIVGSKAVRLNGGDASMTAQEFANIWINKANKLAGGPVTVAASTAPEFGSNPAYSSLSPDQMIALYEEAQGAIRSNEAALRAAQTSQLADIKGSFQLGIATGDPGVTPQAILSSPLADDDKAQLITSWESKNKDKITAADAAERLSGGTGAFNVYDSDDRKAVGLAYDAAVGGGSIYDDDGKARNLAAMIYDRSGIVPKSAMSELRGGLVSGNPAKMAAAASTAAYMAGDNPEALAANEHGEDLAKAAQTWRYATETLGKSPDEAGQYMVDLADPEKRKAREALLETKTVKDKLKKVDDGDVLEVFDTWGPNALTGPDLGATEEAKAVMVADYKSMLEESIVEANGDMDLAEEYAAAKFRKNYGVSNFTMVDDTIIKHPIETAYPPGPDGTHAYVRLQATEALKAEGIEADKIYLQPYDETAADIRAGRPARYMLYYERDGFLNMYNLPFYAEPELASEVLDLSGNRSRRDSNRAKEQDRQRTIDTFGAPGETAVESMNRQAQAIERQMQNVPEAEPVGPVRSGGGGF